jgi:uncharacterized membrane protein (UPF0127 family)
MLFSKKNYPLKTWHIVFLLFVIGVGVILKIFSGPPSQAKIKISTTVLNVLVADTFQSQYQGLSNRVDLGEQDGMLFVFSQVGAHPMVMRKMLFPLDMVWFRNNKIVYMQPNIPLETGKSDSQLMIYASGIPSDMVLELPAGSVQKYGFKIGDELFEVK